MSCIGAWVGSVYNQFEPGERAAKTEELFRNVIFRDDVSYSRFPINRVFGPDLQSNMRALARFLGDPDSYRNLVLPGHILDTMRRNFEFMQDPRLWNQGDFNTLVLENLAANPVSRFLTSMIFLSEVNGLSRIYYPGSSFLASIDFKKLSEPDRPYMYHNAWNLTRQELQLFSNRPLAERHGHTPGRYKQLTAESVCACSALPYIEQTVKIDGDTYCEGALVDTVNFKDLLEDHKDLDEVWVVRIVDDNQIRAPRDLTDGLGNLCMLFAATVGEDDVKLFKHHLERRKKNKERLPRLVELSVSPAINYDWNHSNLDRGIQAGYEAAEEALQQYAQKDQDGFSP
jgi:predicted acylesterase/phospholipase RssA